MLTEEEIQKRINRLVDKATNKQTSRYWKDIFYYAIAELESVIEKE